MATSEAVQLAGLIGIVWIGMMLIGGVVWWCLRLRRKQGALEGRNAYLSEQFSQFRAEAAGLRAERNLLQTQVEQLTGSLAEQQTAAINAIRERDILCFEREQSQQELRDLRECFRVSQEQFK